MRLNRKQLRKIILQEMSRGSRYPTKKEIHQYILSDLQDALMRHPNVSGIRISRLGVEIDLYEIRYPDKPYSENHWFVIEYHPRQGNVEIRNTKADPTGQTSEFIPIDDSILQNIRQYVLGVL